MGSPAGAQGGFWGFLLLACLVFAALLGVSIEQLPDPLIRHDDFEALFGDGDGYYHKTLYEGRWLNYLWIEYGPQWSAQVNYLVYFAAWALFLAGFVQVALPRAEGWRRLACAVIIGASPPLLLISSWFNTLLPAVLVLAAYGLLAVWLSERAMRWLLPLFVPLALTGYTTFPFFLLALCLCRADAPRSLRHLTGLLGLFVISFGAGMALIYGLNWQFHGIFGVPMAEWRNPVPAETWADLSGNLKAILADMAAAGEIFVYEITPALWILSGLSLLALVLLARQAPGRLIYLLAGLGLGLAMILVQGARTGIELPPRVLGFGFVFLALLWTLMSQGLAQSRGLARRLGDKALPLIALFFALSGMMQNHWSVLWQAESREMAAAIAETGAEANLDPSAEVIVTGDMMALVSAQKAHLQKPRAMRLRLFHLTGRSVIVCEETPAACADLPAPARAASVDGQWHATETAGLVVLQLPQQAQLAQP